jgi:hypothetical protein
MPGTNGIFCRGDLNSTSFWRALIASQNGVRITASQQRDRGRTKHLPFGPFGEEDEAAEKAASGP